ncbi:Dual specificity mitogen-activated protein kinase kinase 5 [Pitangus sulphuratus]|nr:Dual specificity mitogen-activated protein kinase kinase 5 [Pitangus sulphuratus]
MNKTYGIETSSVMAMEAQSTSEHSQLSQPLPELRGSSPVAELPTLEQSPLPEGEIISTSTSQEGLAKWNTYRAYHVRSGKILAVKVIPLDITLELQKQIMSELEILYKCDSSYIIGFYGAFFVENRISLCTEFMDGGSLDVYRKIPEHVLGRIAVAVVKGLTYLWSLKILHRDVKPSNMLVNTRGQVKLCDFGVSTQLVNSIAKTYVGTNAYMASGRPKLMEVLSFGSPTWQTVSEFVQKDSEKPGIFNGQAFELLRSSDLSFGVMKKQPKERPAPEDLMGHPFIVQYNDGNAEVVSMWVCRMLEERRATQGAP